jgi:hypothetical protein
MDNIEMVRTKKEENKDIAVALNEGLMQRRKIMHDGGGLIEIMGPLYCDLFNSDRFLLDNIPIRIKIWKSDDIFSLIGKKDNGFNVFFEEVKIRIRHQLVSPRVMMQFTLLKIQLSKFFQYKIIV